MTTVIVLLSLLFIDTANVCDVTIALLSTIFIASWTSTGFVKVISCKCLNQNEQSLPAKNNAKRIVIKFSTIVVPVHTFKQFNYLLSVISYSSLSLQEMGHAIQHSKTQYSLTMAECL